MAQPVIHRCLLRCMIIVLGTGSAAFSHADAPITRDPTQPPASLGSSGIQSAAASSSLQSITIGRKQRHAMINGVTVKIGDTVSEGRIANITEDAVMIKSANGLTTLKLFPNVDKHPHTTVPAPRPSSVHRN